MIQQPYDIIIGGGGAAGRIVLYFLSKQPSFHEKKILFIEAENKLAEKTWCFWHQEEGNHPFQHLITKQWDTLYFAGKDFKVKQSIQPYQYACIHGSDFDEYFTSTFFTSWANVEYTNDLVSNSSFDGQLWKVTTSTNTFTSKEFLSNTYSKRSPNCLLQQFYGQYIRFDHPVFDEQAATLMDFSKNSEDRFQFFYVLPMDAYTALVECTFYDVHPLNESDFFEVLKQFIETSYGQNFEVIRTEFGIIPLLEDVGISNNPSLPTFIGQSAGMIKPSTGYAFQRMVEDAELLVNNFSLGKKRRTKPKRFLWYDKLLLAIIREDPATATYIFNRLFRKKMIRDVLKFLDEGTHFMQEFRLFVHLPWWPFIKRIKQLL